METTPNHLAPENCHICGTAKDQHTSIVHNFWSNADADAEFAKPQANPNTEARYVDEYRPY